MAISLKAFSWDLHKFNEFKLSREDVRKLLANEKARDALKTLTEGALSSSKAVSVAQKLPEKQFLHFTIAYDKKEGLKLIYKERGPLQKDQVKSLLVAKNNELEKFESQIRVLEEYIDAIKTYQKPISTRKITEITSSQPQVKTATSRHVQAKTVASPIQAKAETAVNPRSKREQKVFDKLIKENREFEKRKSIFHRLVNAIEVLYVAADIDGAIRNSISAVTVGATNVVSYLLGLGGGLLFLSSISCMIIAGVRASKALAHKSLESFFIAIGDLISASGVGVLGAALSVHAGAAINGLSDLASKAFAVVPYAVIARSCVDLISSIYQIVVIIKFKMKLASLTSDEPETQELINALEWLQTILQPKPNEKSSTAARAETIVAKKWHAFQIRAGSKAFEFIEKLLAKDSSTSLESLIKDLQKNRTKAKICTRELISDLKSSSLNALGLAFGKLALSIVSLGVGVAMCLDGGAASAIAVSVVFAIASALSIILDSSALQVYLLKKFHEIKEWIYDHIDKIKDRIQKEDIGVFKNFLKMDGFTKSQSKTAIAIFATLAYLLENIEDSFLLPSLSKIPGVGIFLALFSKKNKDKNEDTDSENNTSETDSVLSEEEAADRADEIDSNLQTGS